MATKPPSKRVELLKDRNAKLFAHAAVQRQESTQLERKVDELQEKEEGCQDTVLCVNRLWEQLNGALAFLQYRCGAAPPPVVRAPPPSPPAPADDHPS